VRGALDAPPVSAVQGVVDDLGGRPLCTLIGGGRCAPDRATLYNGTLVRYLDGDIVFCTRAGGALAAAAGTIVSFEIDRIDEAMSEGWSVFVSGLARLVDDDGIRRRARLTHR
jgi:2-methylcitrate dehydratase PrpD